MESNESSPSIVDDLTGTPMTGSGVYAARTPGRCAALPAAAIITSMPLDSASEAKRAALSGVRCAEQTSTSVSTPKSFNVLMQSFSTG